jgi:hypothetical protein
MNHTSTDTTASLTAALNGIRAFGQHYGYDVTYLESLMEASPGAFQAFEGAMGVGRYQKAAPAEALAIAKLTAVRAEDCGPCTELGVKMAREQGVEENVIRGALRGGEGLNPEQLDIQRYARAVAANEEMEPELLPRLEARWGREVIAELALAIVGTRLYPTLRRALGHGKSCTLMPGLIS